MSELGLTTWQRRRLRRQLRQARDVRVYRRTLAILEADRGTSVARIAETLGVTRQSLYNWIDAYLREHDPAALADAPRTGCPGFWTEEARDLLRYLLDQSPGEFDYPDANWTLGLFREQLEAATGRPLSEDTVRRELHRLGYVWKRPRYVLDPDPEREEKTADPPADPPPARAQRHPGRGRDGAAALPAPAGRLVAQGAVRQGAAVGAERSSGDLRRHELDERPPAVPAPGGWAGPRLPGLPRCDP